MKCVPGIFGNLVVKSKLPFRSGLSLEAVVPHPQKGAIKFFQVFLIYDRVFLQKTLTAKTLYLFSQQSSITDV